MQAENTGGKEWLTGMALIIIAPVIVILGAVAVVILSTPVMPALIVIAFATAVLFAGTVVTRQTPAPDKAAKEGPMCESVDLIATLEPENVEMVEALADGPRTAVTATVTKVFGPCPLGLMPGDTWQIGPNGSLSRPICRPGSTALSALFQMANGDAMARSTCCQCVIAGREVTFTVRESVEELR